MMHLSGANMASLWHNIFRGSIECASQSDNRTTWSWVILRDSHAWKIHGQCVANCKYYAPGSFHVAPCNPSLHTNSWYKSTKYITWLYGLCPAILYWTLPNRIMSITAQQLQLAHQLFAQWENRFELIFYQCHVCIHFIRPCVHLTNHLAFEAVHISSPICSSQWTMKHTIGNLEQEILQPSNPFENLAQ